MHCGVLSMSSQVFKIIVPFYNVEEWIGKCVKSIQLQSCKNFKCILVDDISTDNSVEVINKLIKDDNRFTLIKNTEKKFALKNIYEAIEISGTDPEDIIVTLDGDDWFATKKALETLSSVYEEYSCLMTYGSYIEFPSMKRGKFCCQIPATAVRDNSYRENQWVSSHLRTFKRNLWNSIKPEDLKKDQEFFRMTWDMAFMFPMLEMAGPLAVHIRKMLYSYNRQNPLNDDKVNHKLQLETEQYIRSKDKYENRFVVSSILGPSGNLSGVGNQLFCVATALGYAYEYDATAVFPQIKTDKFINKYKDTLYKNLKIGRTDVIAGLNYRESRFEFDEINQYNGILRTTGYFQSFKYFEKHRDKILKDLNIESLQSNVIEKYGDFSDFVSIHVRRGDYLELSDYHHNLQIDYYRKAVKNFDQDTKFLIFSNDIGWCKQNFDFLKHVSFSEALEDWEDIILMSTCRDNIIANSSFSWWGAWLNENKNKIVIAPKNWFGPKYAHKNTKDLLPEDWIVI